MIGTTNNFAHWLLLLEKKTINPLVSNRFIDLEKKNENENMSLFLVIAAEKFFLSNDVYYKPINKTLGN